MIVGKLSVIEIGFGVVYQQDVRMTDLYPDAFAESKLNPNTNFSEHQLNGTPDDLMDEFVVALPESVFFPGKSYSIDYTDNGNFGACAYQLDIVLYHHLTEEQ
ncbi:hypothetical protein SAMN05421780_11046 [Flexibacter flexilis DSM 6793]|uniref:Uncharacterized protein n=1 Tax=Flexibacter flexilis DSM 6793 TaxID=927664 RepID=A0A1I1M621_9BACT|nr:hypothetical protein [Flexibacter flexilis]SFC80851.1 hypothetical protein SAMN05421780_11046 [Flexibacter flexilis DSM 6793]